MEETIKKLKEIIADQCVKMYEMEKEHQKNNDTIQFWYKRCIEAEVKLEESKNIPVEVPDAN